MSVQIPQFTEDLNIISSLADQPTMTSSELKAEFDLAGNKIKDYINNTFLPKLDDVLSDITATDVIYDDSETELTATNVQDAIEKIKELIDGLSFTASNISFDKGNTGMLATNVQTAIVELKTAINTLSTSVSSKLRYSDFAFSTTTLSGTLSAGTNKVGTQNISKGGYFPLGIIGEENNQEAIDIRRQQLTSKSNGSGVISYIIQNEDYGNPRSYTIKFDILWVKVT